MKGYNGEKTAQQLRILFASNGWEAETMDVWGEFLAFIQAKSTGNFELNLSRPAVTVVATIKGSQLEFVVNCDDEPQKEEMERLLNERITDDSLKRKGY